MLITEQYRELNRGMHQTKVHYGTSGAYWAHEVRSLLGRLGTTDVLDYGAGKLSLQTALGFPIHNYDPAIAGIDKAPLPADLVVCGDVLEHIEPDCLDAVLDDLKRVTCRVGFFVIDTAPANKHLPDGRNAHLIQEGAAFWIPKLRERFKVIAWQPYQTRLTVWVRAKR